MEYRSNDSLMLLLVSAEKAKGNKSLYGDKIKSNYRVAAKRVNMKS